jgi:hypothetical protein
MKVEAAKAQEASDRELINWVEEDHLSRAHIAVRRGVTPARAGQQVREARRRIALLADARATGRG